MNSNLNEIKEHLTTLKEPQTNELDNYKFEKKNFCNSKKTPKSSENNKHIKINPEERKHIVQLFSENNKFKYSNEKLPISPIRRK